MSADLSLIDRAAARIDNAVKARGGAAATGLPTATIDPARAVAHARAVLAVGTAERTPPPYPVEALGPLAQVCRDIATEGQVQPAMAGQCLLGAASLLTQGLHNVETLAGARPLSLYLLTLGDSGDGKSTGQSAALGAVNDWQRRAAERYRNDLDDFEAERVRRKKGDDPPDKPRQPYRLVGDATVEGLRRDLEEGPSSQGIFTDEAAAILAGYGMSADHRAKTAGVYSKLWDAGHLSVSRVTGGRIERYGRRVAAHWLIQPAAAAESVGDPLLSALGFWPRFLSAWPAPQEPRTACGFAPGRVPSIGHYWQRCAELLAEELPEDVTDAPTLPLTDEARAVLAPAFEAFERAARRGELRPIKPFALRAAEQACRVAGVLAAFGGDGAVSGDAMRGGLALVSYSLATWQTLTEDSARMTHGADALRLYAWLVNRPGHAEALPVILTRGPGCTRTKDSRDAALAELQDAGLVAVGDGRAFVRELPRGIA